MKKTIKTVVAGILAIVVLAVIVVFSLDSLIRKGVETAASSSLGVDVKLKRAHLSLLRGRLILSGLRIGNPEGFKSESLFEAGHIAIAVRPAALLGDEVTIDTIILAGPAVTIEQSSTGTNLSKILENIDRGEPEAPGPSEPSEPTGPEKEKTYRIGVLRIAGAKVTFSSFLTAKAPVTVPLPDIVMKDISSADGGGVAAAQVIRQVLVRLLRAAVTEGGGIIPAETMQEITGNLRGLLPGLRDEAAEQTKGFMEKATGAIRELFGR